MLTASVSAFELDTSVDDEIRKNYNPSKIEEDKLPDLPSGINTPTKTNSASIKPQQQSSNSSIVPNTNIDTEFSKVPRRIKTQTSTADDSYTQIKIKRGTKFKVKSQTKVSDWNSAGAGMTFVSVSPVTKRYVSFPTGTVFKGVIEESHQPTYGGNGGLLKLKANFIKVSGNTYNIDAKIVNANNKHIYFNNIKGKRGYVKGISRQINKGDRFYKKTRNASTKLAGNPIGVIISPIPTIAGIVGYGANLIISPVTAIWSKGEHITLPAGTSYTLKLR